MNGQTRKRFDLAVLFAITLVGFSFAANAQEQGSVAAIPQGCPEIYYFGARTVDVIKIDTPELVERCLTTRRLLRFWLNQWEHGDEWGSGSASYPRFDLQKDFSAYAYGRGDVSIDYVALTLSSWKVLPHYQDTEKIKWKSLGPEYSGVLVPSVPNFDKRLVQNSYGQILMVEKNGRVLDFSRTEDRLEFARDFTAALGRELAEDQERGTRVPLAEFKSLGDIVESFRLVHEKLADIYLEKLSHGEPVVKDFDAPVVRQLEAAPQF